MRSLAARYFSRFFLPVFLAAQAPLPVLTPRAARRRRRAGDERDQWHVHRAALVRGHALRCAHDRRRALHLGRRRRVLLLLVLLLVLRLLVLLLLLLLLLLTPVSPCSLRAAGRRAGGVRAHPAAGGGAA